MPTKTPIPRHLLDEQGVIAVHAVPKSPRNKIEGEVVDAEGRRWLKVRIAAAPEDGKANKELLKFLAKCWNLPASRLTLVSGETARHKRIKIDG